MNIQKSFTFSNESFYRDFEPMGTEYGSIPTKGIIGVGMMALPDTASILATRFADFLRKIRKFDMDYSMDSLSIVEAVFEGFVTQKKDIDKNAAIIYTGGCYVGEVIRKHLKGKWIDPAKENWPQRIRTLSVMLLPNNDYIDPVAKSFRRSYYGGKESIWDWYHEKARGVGLVN